MPQLRQDCTTKEWVIIAAERSKMGSGIHINVAFPEETADYLRKE
jgi:hypothetical protein